MINEQSLAQSFLKIHPSDNVLVALKDLSEGTRVLFDNTEILIKQDVKAKHKFFINDMNVNDDVIMY